MPIPADPNFEPVPLADGSVPGYMHATDVRADSERLAGAVSFRQAHGLPSDTASLAAADRAAPPGVFHPFGVALTTPELAIMRDRMRFQDSVTKVADALDTQSGGHWLDPTTGRLVVSLQPGATSSQVSSMMKASGVDTSRVDFRQARRPYSELLKRTSAFTTDEIPKLAAQGLTVTSVGPKVEDNLVRVGILNLTEDQRTALQATYPDLSFFADMPSTNVDNRLDTGGAWKAGAGIQATGSSCTLGLPVVASGHRYVLTAGHCNGAGNVHGVSTVWDHNWDSNYPLIANYYQENSAADVAVINPADYSVSNLMILNSAQSANITTPTHIPVSVGDTLCSSSRNASSGDDGWRCGSVTEVNMTYLNTGIADPTGTHIRNDASILFNGGIVQEGDSGSPMVTVPTLPATGIANVGGAGILHGKSLTDNRVGRFSTLTNIFNVMAPAYGSASVMTSPRTEAFLGAQSSRCINVPNGSHTNNVALVILGCNGQPQQVFTVLPRYGAYALIPTSDASKCVDVRLPNSLGAIIQQYGCFSPPNSNQMWFFSHTGINYSWPDFVLKTAQAGQRCIDVVGYGTADNSALQQWDCAPGGGVGNQRWKHY